MPLFNKQDKSKASENATSSASKKSFWTKRLTRNSDKKPQNKSQSILDTDGTIAANGSAASEVSAEQVATSATSTTDINSNHSLWDQAYDALRSKDPELIKKYEALLAQHLLPAEYTSTTGQDSTKQTPISGSLDSKQRQRQLDRMIRAGLDKQETKGNIYIGGHSISIRSMLENVASLIEMGKDWVDDAVKASPEASVAWSIVCLALPLLTKPSEVENASSDGFVYVSARMHYYIAIEELLLPKDHSVASDKVYESIRLDITLLYQQILEFQISYIIRCYKNTLKTLVGDIHNSNDWKSMQTSIKDLEDRIYQDSSGITSSISRNVLQELLVQAQNTSLTIQRLLETAQDHLDVSKDHRDIASKALKQLQNADVREINRDERECLQVFCTEPPYQDTKDRIAKHVEGTCKWALSQPVYEDWMKTEQDILLISADPGCGKSVLAKYMVDYELPRVFPDASICYFFFRDQLQDKLSLALCALIHQLLSKDTKLIKHALPQYHKFGTTIVSNISVLCDILYQAVHDPIAMSTVIVLDALDECKSLECEHLFKIINGTEVSDAVCFTGRKIKILLTSRPYDSILSAFNYDDRSSCLHIPGDQESEAISQEVNLVIEQRLADLEKRNRISLKARAALATKFSQVPHRTYLWVALVFDELKVGLKRTQGELPKLLQKLSLSINEAYEKILSRSTDDLEAQRRIHQVFCAMLTSRRLLSISEIQCIAKLDISPPTYAHKDLDLESELDFTTKLRNWCGLILQVSSGHVTFIHQTAKEFLLYKFEGEGTDLLHSEMVTAEICIRYLLLYDFVEYMEQESPSSSVMNLETTSVKDYDPYPFLQYAAASWDFHLNNVGNSANERLLIMALQLCEPSSRAYTNWSIYRTSFAWRRFMPTSTLGAVVALASNNLWEYTLQQMNAKQNQNQLDNTVRDAILMDRQSRLETLLDNGASSKVRYLDGSTALHDAAKWLRPACVSLLLENGADINGQDHEGRSALHILCSSLYEQHKYAELVQMLLRKGADPEIRDKRGRTPLYVAVQYDILETVKVILDYGGSPLSKDDYGRIIASRPTLLGGRPRCPQDLVCGSATVRPDSTTKRSGSEDKYLSRVEIEQQEEEKRKVITTL